MEVDLAAGSPMAAARKRKSSENENEMASGNQVPRKVLAENNVKRGSALPVPGWTAKGRRASPRQSHIPALGPREGQAETQTDLAEETRSEGGDQGSSAPTPSGEATDEVLLGEELAPATLSNNLDLGVVLPEATIENLSVQHFGTVDDREACKADLLKRTKPEQKLFGYPKKYVDNETKRLATGIKDHLTARDKFIDACKDYERALLSSFEATRSKVSQLHLTAQEARNRVAGQEAELKRLRSAELDLKAAMAKLEANASAFSAKEEALKQDKDKLSDHIAALEKDITAANERATQQTKDAKALEDRLAAAEEARRSHEALLADAERLHKDAVKQLETKHEQAGAEWKTREAALEREMEDWRRKADAAEERAKSVQDGLESANKRAREAEDEAARHKQNVEHLQSQVQAMEAQSRQKDAHLDKTLETFQQNQTFSQERIANLSEEKARLEARVHDLSTVKGELEIEKTRLTGELKEAKDANEQLKERTAAQGGKLEKAEQRLAELERSAALYEHNLERATREAAAATVKADKLHVELAQERGANEVQRAESAKQQAALEEKVDSLSKRNGDLESEIEALKKTYADSGVSSDRQLERLCEVSKEAELLKRQVTDRDRLQQELSELRARLKETEEKLFQSDKAKRELHNEVQALKGKVRVVARVRPVLSVAEGAMDEHGEEVRLRLPDFMRCSVDGQSLAVEVEQEQSQSTQLKKHNFSFDRVFQPDTSQEQVFDEVSSFVQSALDGYNVCLFSYGQTGSGKTFTMSGDFADQKHRGIIPRAIDQIMSYQVELRARGWEYTLEATYVEIYNETIQDLLVAPRKGTESPKKLEIRDSKKEIIVANAQRLPIASRDDIHRVLNLADKNRSVAATDSNDHSSRSHSVFTLFIVGVHREYGAKVVGSLSMCDLAGSERISRSGAEGDRLKEAQNINKSLSALANVFSSLHKKTPHVPYRNSKLTHMLQPCFAGEGKTMMIVNLSPELADRGESLCSLRFAGQVSATELGRAKKQIQAMPAQ